MDLDATISLQKHIIDGLRADIARVTNERREYWRERLIADGVLVPAEQLARVTAERQNWKEWAEEARAMFHKQTDAAAVMKTRSEQRNAELVAALHRIASCVDAPDVDATGEWQFGLHCGVEDRDCRDRYEGADYGHAVGVDKALTWARNEANFALERAESATCQKSTNPSQISSESATPGLRTDNPMAEPVMGGLPRYDGEKLSTPAKQQSAS